MATEGREVFPHRGSVTAADRRRVLGHGPATVWFTGLSGSGKSTLAFAVEEALTAAGVAVYVLDGDNVREGLCADLGFAPEDRTENIRRVGEVAALFHDAGLITLASFLSPYQADRDRVRALHPDGAFVEVHVDTPLQVCEERDVKGLYARARAGELPEFSGVTAPYEPPVAPELRLDTGHRSLTACVAAVLGHLHTTGVLTDRHLTTD